MRNIKTIILLSIFAVSYFSFADEFKVTITGYSISIEGEKSEKLWEILKSFPLREEKDIFEIAKNIDKNFIIEKEFEIFFNAKDNILTIVEPNLEWGKLHLEIQIIPKLINDVIVEFNVEETPKWWEEKMKEVIGEKKGSEEVIEENRKKTKEEILKKAKEENWSQERLQRVLEQMGKNYNLLKGKGKLGPKSKLEGGRTMFKLGKINKFYGDNVQGETSNEGKSKTFTYLRTILIERK